MIVTWSVDAGDWHKRDICVKRWVNCVVEGAKPGNIILMHDDSGDRSKSVQALPEIIDQLRPHRYQFVTLYVMLQIKDQELMKSPWFY